jgi:hypothetical protein
MKRIFAVLVVLLLAPLAAVAQACWLKHSAGH